MWVHDMSNFTSPESVILGYARAYDTLDIEAVNDCFSADAEFSYAIDGQPEVHTFIGRESIVEMNAATISAQTGFGRRRHVVSNLEGSIHGDMATFTCYLTLLLATSEGMSLITSGEYSDVLERSDGSWRIQRRHLQLDLPF